MKKQTIKWTIDIYRNKPMKNSINHDESKFDEGMYKLIDENDLNFCGKQILKQAIKHQKQHTNK